MFNNESTQDANYEYVWADRDPHRRLTSVAIKILIAAASFVILTGPLGNALTIIAILTEKRLKRVTLNYYVIALAMGDFIVCTFYTPVYILTLVVGRIQRDLCMVAAFTFMVLMNFTAVCITAIAVNRYVLIFRGLKSYQEIFSPKKTVASIICMLAMCIVLQVLTPFIHHLSAIDKNCIIYYRCFGYNVPYAMCVMNCLEGYEPLIYASIIYIPCLITSTFIYVRFFVARISDVNKCQKSNEDGEKAPARRRTLYAGEVTEVLDITEKPRLKRFTERLEDVEYQMFDVFLAFVICSLPSSAAVFLLSILPASYIAIITFGLILNSSLNFMIYGMKNPLYRAAYVNVLRKSWPGRAVSPE